MIGIWTKNTQSLHYGAAGTCARCLRRSGQLPT
jgi:hypothetical protein